MSKPNQAPQEDRDQAIALLAQGKTLTAVAFELGYSIGCIGHWRTRYQHEHPEGVLGPPSRMPTRPPPDPAILKAPPEDSQAAIALLAQGKSLTDVAFQLGYSISCIGHWRTRYQHEHPEGVLGPPSRMKRRPTVDPAIIKALPAELVKGPRAHGFDRDEWTIPLIADLVERQHGIRANHTYYSIHLRKYGVRWQKPYVLQFGERRPPVDPTPPLGTGS